MATLVTLYVMLSLLNPALAPFSLSSFYLPPPLLPPSPLPLLPFPLLLLPPPSRPPPPPSLLLLLSDVPLTTRRYWMLWHKREFPSGWLHPSLSWRRYITSHISSQEGCACRKDILSQLEVNMGTRQMKGKPGGCNAVGKALVMVWFPETASFQFHILLTHL